jgi:putative flippase GtrA
MENYSQTAQNQISLIGRLEALLAKYPIILQILKFGAIGVINTALDFLILNFSSKTLGITSGAKLGMINTFGFVLAVIQSFYWNRYWTFGQQQVSVVKNFTRLCLVGILGVLAIGFVFLGAKVAAPVYFYVFVIAIFLIVQAALWLGFGFFKTPILINKKEFILFIAVSVVGLLINDLLISLISSHFLLSQNADLNKNIAKVFATGASLVWNFLGYKLFVFKD